MPSGSPDVVPAPALAPCTTPVGRPVPVNEDVVRRWLQRSAVGAVRLDDGTAGTLVVEVAAAEPGHPLLR